MVEMSIVCPDKSLTNGSTRVTKPAEEGNVNGNELPTRLALVAVNANVGGALTVSELPVMVIVEKLERSPVVAITVIVCVPLKAVGENAALAMPELFVGTVPKGKF